MSFTLYLITLLAFLGIDMIWLNGIAKTFYAKQLGFLMAKNPNLLAALLFYLIFAAGLVVFVIQPALDKKLWTQALFAGAFFGLVTYATYDLTNLATVKNWPVIITVVDLLWGTTLTALTSILTFFIATKFRI
jgi:uncharacterized membrane protein